MTRQARTPRDHLFTMYLTAAEHEDMKIRADANDISAAEYVRRALAAVAAVGGSEEFLLRKTKGKKK